MKAYINAIGLQANGLEGWSASQAILKSEKEYQNKPLSKYSPLFLPANERRRVTNTIKLALRTAEATLLHYPHQNIPTLFACVDGDTEIFAKMATAVLADEPMISPIHFHNSVHNAPAGYWMIGQQNQQAASSISAGKYQIANLLIEAISQLNQPQSELLIVAYDLPVDPIIETLQTAQPFAFGLVLAQQQTEKSLACIELKLMAQSIEAKISPNWFGDNISASFLPALMAIAQNKTRIFNFAVSDQLTAEIKIIPF